MSDITLSECTLIKPTLVFGEQGILGARGIGISSIQKTATSVLEDTYTITFTDNNTTTFQVKNGISVTNATIEENSHLILSLSNNEEIDCGEIKGLSDNDFTTEEKNKLSGIASGAEVNTIQSISINGENSAPDENKNINLVVEDKKELFLVNMTYTNDSSNIFSDITCDKTYTEIVEANTDGKIVYAKLVNTKSNFILLNSLFLFYVDSSYRNYKF